MSSVVRLKASNLRKVLTTIKPLFPKSTTEIPLGLQMSNGKLNIVCLQGLVFQSTIPVDDVLALNTATILYHDISTLLPSEGDIDIEFTPTHIYVYAKDFDVKFPVGYSVVEEQDFSKLAFSSINNSGFVEGFSRLLNMNLEKLMNQVSPIVVRNGLALQRFHNIWVQVRTTGLTFNAVLSTDHIKLLNKFVPSEVCTSIPGTLVFRNSTGILQLPCKPDNDTSKVTELMNDLGEPVNLHIRSYLERVKQIAKLDTKAHCNITLYKEGLKTTVSNNQVELSVKLGNTEHDVLQVCKLPIQLWITLLRGLDADIIQVLIGGGKICLRTGSTVILARVLL